MRSGSLDQGMERRAPDDERKSQRTEMLLTADTEDEDLRGVLQVKVVFLSSIPPRSTVNCHIR